MLEELLLTTTALTGVFGGMTAFIGLKAFKRGREESLLFTTAGFSFITVGTVFAAVGCVFLGLNEVMVHLVGSAAVAAGLLSIIYSVTRVGPTVKPTLADHK